MQHIYIDLETTPGPVPPTPDTIQAPANYKDPEKIAAYRQAAVEDEWRKESLLSHKGRVLCIGWAVGDDEVQCAYGNDEREVMESFRHNLGLSLEASGTSIQWVGFNLTTFDLNWLRHRAVKYGMRDLAYRLPADRYPKNVFDLRAWWNGADYQGKGKLEEIAAFFGLPGKTGGIDGSKVFDYWRAGRIMEIVEYCKRDVELTRELHERINA